MTRGFLDAGGYEPIFAVESDRDAAATYEANFGSHVARSPDGSRPATIEEVDSFPPADVIIGGPPCQGFSPLNRAGVGWERRGLWREYLRALSDAQPTAFVMENVPELLDSQEFAHFRDAARAMGYTVEGRVLNAADHGVPQRRRRAIAIGTMLGNVPWPEPTHRDPTLPTEPALEPWVTFRQAVAGLPLVPDGERWHRPRNPRPTSIIRYGAVPVDGGNRFQMQENLDREGRGALVPRCWRNKPTGTTDVFGRLWWDRPAYTIRTEFYKPEKGRYLHPSEDRPITVREAARCMSMADDFTLPEQQSMTSVAKQVGNAVPPLLAQRIACSLADAVDAHDRGHPKLTAAA
ncbi:MAG: (cytosine-5)-methyltransferase 1 [Thermoleophilaceae bacterium]|jgi:DNA (cytosine-5)-methyltransferase 1|nr:(cytosine-5)-methyltransferase 1 [Thermoleophilaceae bacterium]